VENIDWSKAPEGYPIWITDNDKVLPPGWHREGKHRFVDMGGSFWSKPVDSYTVHRKPSPWNGQGLPPVGTVCEAYEHNAGLWVRVEVLKHGENDHPVMVCRDSEQLATKLFWADQFRPIRTPEQIAADERKSVIDVACDDIENIVGKYNTTLSHSMAIKVTIEAMIDAGYRKP
jgi:tellurite resistance-related uncharacterized protein